MSGKNSRFKEVSVFQQAFSEGCRTTRLHSNRQALPAFLIERFDSLEAFLRGGDVIGNSPERDRFLDGIENHITRERILVARLAYATHIDQRFLIARQIIGIVFFQLMRLDPAEVFRQILQRPRRRGLSRPRR